MTTVKTPKQDEFSQGQEKLSEAYKLAGEAASDIVGGIKSQAKTKISDNKDKAMDATKVAEAFIQEKPLLSLGCAFAAGWLVSKILK